MKRSLKVLGAGLAIGSMMLAGCAQPNSPTTTPPTTPATSSAPTTSAPPPGGAFAGTPSGAITAWAFNNADDVGQARLVYAQSVLPGVTITMDATGFDAQKMTTLIAGGTMPDVIQMDRMYVAGYAAQDLLMPLDDCYTALGMDPTKMYYPNVLADVTYDGKVYAVPQFFQPAAIIVNNRVAKEAKVDPKAWDTSNLDSLLTAIRATYKADAKGNPIRLGFDPQAHSNAMMWILLRGGKLMDATGKPALDDPANVGVLEWVKQLYDAQGGYAKVKSFSDTFDFFGDKNQYVTDQVAAEMNWQWYPNVLAGTMDKVDLYTVPLKDANGNAFAAATGTSFVIPKAAKNPVAACAWAVNTTTNEAWNAAAIARQATRVAKGQPNTGLMTGNPTADQAIKATYVKSLGNAGFDQTIAAFYDVLTHGTSYGSSPAAQSIQNEISNAMISYLNGDKDAATALKDAQAAALQAYNDIVG